jgi:aminoglycoside phosphotransferase (APT) family kinase protein
MYTRPSVDELLDGIRRTIERELLPLLADNPDAERFALPILEVVDRAMAEWPTRADAYLADVSALRDVLEELAYIARHEPSSTAVRRVVDALPTIPEGAVAGDLAEIDNVHKASLVEVMSLLDLPAGSEASPARQKADAFLVQALLDYADRELAAVPSIDLSAVKANNNQSMANQPIGDMPQRMEAFLEETLGATGECRPGSVSVTNFERLAGGNSRDTYLFEAVWLDQDGAEVKEPCVMQREAVSSVVDTDRPGAVQSGTRRRPEIEFQAVQVLESAGLRVPHMLWQDPEGRWLERPFVVCRRVAGTASDVELRAGDPAKLAAVYDDYVATLAALHDLNPDELGLDFLGTVSREDAAGQQVRLFESAFRANALEVHPGIEYLIRWLHRNLPVADEISVIHGDFRRGNFLIEDDHVTAYIDWELVHLGDPIEEIAFMYWAFWSLEPVIPLDDLLARYEAARGISVNRETLAFYRLFQELKMLVIGLTGIHSYFASESRQLAYTNPYLHTYTTECCRRALSELASGGPFYDFPAGKDAPLLY